MSCKGLSMHIVREEHWAANGSHALIVAKRKSIVFFPCFPGMDVPVEIFPN